MLLVNPPAYITAADFRSMPNDYDLTAYNDSALTDMLVRASGLVDGLLRKSNLAQERTERFRGSGNSSLSLHNRPLLYVKQMQFVIPGLVGQTIPLDRVNVDYLRGDIQVLRPLALEGIGYQPFFPDRVPIDITYAWGFGANPYLPPAWTAVDASPGIAPLVPGPYVVGVTTRTQWGETPPNLQTITTASGAIAITVQQTLGAYSYRVYAIAAPASGPVDPTTLSLVGEIPSATFTDGPSAITITSLSAPPYTYPQLLSLTDTSAPPLPSNFREAMRLLTMQIIYEQNNLSNRGVQRTESGRKSTTWRSTEGQSGKGVPLYIDQAAEILAGDSLQEIF